VVSSDSIKNATATSHGRMRFTDAVNTGSGKTDREYPRSFATIRSFRPHHIGSGDEKDLTHPGARRARAVEGPHTTEEQK
jgi:hypothetical protein